MTYVPPQYFSQINKRKHISNVFLVQALKLRLRNIEIYLGKEEFKKFLKEQEPNIKSIVKQHSNSKEKIPAALFDYFSFFEKKFRPNLFRSKEPLSLTNPSEVLYRFKKGEFPKFVASEYSKIKSKK
jgi:hypothetical protein